MSQAHVILPLAVRGTFTYAIPEPLKGKVAEGTMVVVQFSSRKHFVGCVDHVSEDKENQATKEILEVLEDVPPIASFTLSLWRWMAGYYLCTLGEVLHAALPAGMKLDHELQVVPGNRFSEARADHFLDFLPDDGLQMKEVVDRLEGRVPLSRIRHWIDVGVLELHDRWSRKAGKLGEKAIRTKVDEEELHAFIEQSKAPRQVELLLHLLEKGGRQRQLPRREVCPRPFPSSLLNALIKKGVLEEFWMDLLQSNKDEVHPLHRLSSDQKKALEGIEQGFEENKAVLLYGVTSSGKTEVYTHLIDKVLRKKRQALFLMPEIALTTQMIQRLQRFFGEKVVVYHSMMPESERSRIWKRINRGDPLLVLGARSGLLLPFRELDLIVVDEEHETTYKQQDPAPRYHARDLALYCAMHRPCSIVLGSATPSLESMENVEKGRFACVRMNHRYGNFQMPEIRLCNVSQLSEEEELLGPELLQAIQETLEKGEQIILFQNRRGFSPYVLCDHCAHVPGCPNCDISLSYHRFGQQLRCHYCGHREEYRPQCNECRLGTNRVKGVGTQRIEERLHKLFPECGIERLDLDNTRSRRKMQQLIDRFERNETQMLIGTQMVTKGLDFKNVGLVGVISADGLLNYPDFRTSERCFQLVAQVSGRAGRGMEGGKVLLQTKDVSLDLLKDLRDHDHEAIYRRERYFRKQYHYPPFSRLIRIVLAHPDRLRVEEASRLVGGELTQIFGASLLGPEEPVVARLKNRYLRQFLLKVAREGAPTRTKETLKTALEKVSAHSAMKGVRVILDVDPQQ